MASAAAATGSAKEQYEAAVALLGGKTKARRDFPWQLAALKRKFAEHNHGGAKGNMIASAAVIEAEARANNVPNPAEVASGSGGGGGGGGGGGSGGGGGGGRR